MMAPLDYGSTGSRPPYTYVTTVYGGSRISDMLEATNSMLAQTCSPSEVVIVIDGPIPAEVDEGVERMRALVSNECAARVQRLERNVGPGLAGQCGIDLASHELVARLDSDDLALPERIEREMAVFAEHPELCSVGTWVREFDDSGRGRPSVVELPETPGQISAYARRRCPCRQSSLLYRKSAILAVGGYRSLRIAEEWDLYNRLIKAGYRCWNIPEPLVLMRTDPSYFARRGGASYARDILAFKWGMLRRRETDPLSFAVSAGSSLVASLVPNSVRSALYRNLLRRGEDRA